MTYGKLVSCKSSILRILFQECVLHLQDKLANAKDRADAAEQCKLMLDEQMKVLYGIYLRYGILPASDYN